MAAAAAACVKSVEGRAACVGSPRPPGPPAYLYVNRNALLSTEACSGTTHSTQEKPILPFLIELPLRLLDSGEGAGNIQPFCRTARLMASSHWPGEGPCLPSSETGSPRVAPSAIHALLYVALASTTFGKRLLSQALRGGQGRAATCHTRHHGATRGASCRAHGVPQNLQGSGSHQREPAKPLSSRHSSEVLDLKRCPAKGGGPGVGAVVVYSADWSQGQTSMTAQEEGT